MNKIDSYKNITFTSGLSKQILNSAKSNIPELQEKVFAYQGIEAQFLNNSSASFANNMCLNIFKDLFKRFKLNLSLPPAVFIYQRNNIVNKSYADNFCIPETQDVLIDEYPFSGRSVFFKNFHNLEEINDITEFQFQNKRVSSSHFLAPFLHEWIHSFHLDVIYKTFGYGGNCEYMREVYPKKNTKINGFQLLKKLELQIFSDTENQIIYDTLGEYSTLPENQYLEVFSEAWTKFICNSIDNFHLVKNPFDEFKKTNKNFQAIIYKILLFK